MKFVGGRRNLMAVYLIWEIRCFVLVVLPLEAAEPSSRSLIPTNLDRLGICAVANTDRSDVKEWHPAQVPGVVQTDLLHSALIPDLLIATTRSICNGSAWLTGSIIECFR